MFGYPPGMREASIHSARSLVQSVGIQGTLAWLGLYLGVVMPVAAGLIFPTYHHILPSTFMENAKLLEFPFVACELAVIVWANVRGMDRGRQWRMLPRDVRWAAAALVAAMLASSLLISAHPLQSLLQTLIQIVHLYFAVAVYYLVQTRSEHDLDGPDDFFRWLAIGLVVLAFYTLWRFRFPPPLSDLPWGKIEWGFALPGFINVRYLGTWCAAIATPLSIQLLYRETNRRLTFWHWAFLFATAFAMWSGTRAALLGMGGAAVTFAIFMRPWPDRRALVVTTGLTLLAFCLALIFQFDDPAFQLIRFGQNADFGVDDLSSGRIVLWIATIHRWLDSPLFGWGTGSLFWEVDIGWRHTQPHNAILQFLFSWGIVGCVPALWLLGRAILSAHASASGQPRLWPMLGMVYALLWMSMVDGALYYPRFVMMIMLGFAVILAQRGTTKISVVRD